MIIGCPYAVLHKPPQNYGLQHRLSTRITLRRNRRFPVALSRLSKRVRKPSFLQHTGTTQMLENSPPALIDAIRMIALLKLLSEPDGLRQIIGELKPLTDAAIAAHKKLGARQKEIAAAEADLKAAREEH